MTMLALTLMVGIVIDDAIVVLENIYRFVEEKGMHPMQAAVEGTREIGLAVLATTLSLLAVFIPVGFMTGIVGRFMSSFGLTAAAAIAVSLIVSFTLTPMLAARWIKSKEGSTGPKKKRKGGEGEASVVETFEFSEERSSDWRSDHEGSSKSGWFYSKIDGTYTLAAPSGDALSVGGRIDLHTDGRVDRSALQVRRNGVPCRTKTNRCFR